MNNHSFSILNEMQKNQGVSEEYLEKELGLTNRQVRYSIQLINNYLSNNGFSSVIKKRGLYYLGTDYLEVYQRNDHQVQLKELMLASEDRQYVILLYLLNRDEIISIDHLTYLLKVSRNTVWGDLKKIKGHLEKKHLCLTYQRRFGYAIQGSEWNKRLLIIECIKKIFLKYNENFLYEIMNNADSLDKILVIKSKLSEIEDELKLLYSDNDWNTLLFSLIAIINRIEKCKRLDEINYNIQYKELSDTNEYKATELLLTKFPEISEADRLFITLQLVTNSSQNVGYSIMENKELDYLKESLNAFLEVFETHSLIRMMEKEGLLLKLLDHFRPAYYRIKYHLTTNYAYLEKIKIQYHVLYDLVQESIQPLEDFFQSEIPEEELLLLTLFIGGHMLKNDGFSYTKVNALVICTSGTSMSKIMRDELQQVFPEIHFLPAMSKREYQAYTGAYDIVFSSIPLKVDNTKRIFLVNELLDDEEKKMLKRQVNKELYLHEEKELYEEVSEVVKQHAKVMNPKKLESELKILLTHVKREEPKKRIDIRSLSKPSLTDLLTEEFIQFSDESEWLEVIKQSMTPLLRTHSITENYYKKMINVYEHPVSSIILRKKLAIPHLSPVDGVRKLGFSLLINQQDIYVNQSPVNLFVAIAPMDNESHLLALSQLVKISKNNQIVEALKKSKTKKECIFELKRFLSEE